MLLTTYHMLLTTYIFSRRLDNKRPCCVLYGLDLMDPFILHLGIWWISCCGHHTHVIQCLRSMTWTLNESLSWLFSVSICQGRKAGLVAQPQFFSWWKPPVVGNLPLVAALNPACRLHCSQEGQGWQDNVNPLGSVWCWSQFKLVQECSWFKWWSIG